MPVFGLIARHVRLSAVNVAGGASQGGTPAVAHADRGIWCSTNRRSAPHGIIIVPVAHYRFPELFLDCMILWSQTP
jgi:hypothetical protein